MTDVVLLLFIMPPPLGYGALSNDACLTSVCHVHWAKLRTERPTETKIGTEIADVTRDSDTTFKVKRSTCRGRGLLWRPPAYSLFILPGF